MKVSHERFRLSVLAIWLLAIALTAAGALTDSSFNRAALRDHLIRHEGVERRLYQDSLGQPHIGVGRYIGPGGGITRDEAFYLLDNDIERVVAELDAQLPWWRNLDTVRQQALAAMAFQMGMPRLRQFHGTLSALEAGDYDAAADRATQTLWAEQTPRRARQVIEMLRTGEWP